MADIYSIMLALGIIAVFYILAELVNYIIKGIEKLTSKTPEEFNEYVVSEVKSPIRLVFIVFGIYLAVRYISIEGALWGVSIIQVFIIAGILIGAHVISRGAASFIRWYRAEVYAKKLKSRLDETLVPFVKRAVAIIVYAIALLIIFNRLGIEIGPFLAGLGIAGIAIALALQDTLSNLFAGVYIATDRPISIGDYIELDLGEGYRGYVNEISWRTTRIRTLPGNYIVIPNSRLVQSVLTNYDKPKKDMSLIFTVGVSYGSNLEKVEKVTINTAKKIMKKIEGGVPDHEPFIRYKEFSDSSINFSVIMRVKSFVDQYLIKHEFVKELHKAYRKNGISIPFPQRDVWMKK